MSIAACELFPTGWLSGFAKPAFYSPGLACTCINLGTCASATRQRATATLGHVPNRIRHDTCTRPLKTQLHIHYSTSSNKRTNTIIEFGPIRYDDRQCPHISIGTASNRDSCHNVHVTIIGVSNHTHDETLFRYPKKTKIRPNGGGVNVRHCCIHSSITPFVWLSVGPN